MELFVELDTDDNGYLHDVELKYLLPLMGFIGTEDRFADYYTAFFEFTQLPRLGLEYMAFVLFLEEYNLHDRPHIADADLRAWAAMLKCTRHQRAEEVAHFNRSVEAEAQADPAPTATQADPTPTAARVQVQQALEIARLEQEMRWSHRECVRNILDHAWTQIANLSGPGYQ